MEYAFMTVLVFVLLAQELSIIKLKKELDIVKKTVIEENEITFTPIGDDLVAQIKPNNK